MKLKVRIYFEDDQNDSFMGIGVLWLLEGVVKYGSIRKAAEEMKMSYTKAHQILKKLEESLGMSILERHRGGNNRTGANLTPFGDKFLKKYREFIEKIDEISQTEFKVFMKDMEMDDL